MTKQVFQIVDDFYWASWDLSVNLHELYVRAANNDNTPLLQNTVLDRETPLPLTIPALRKQFQKYALPFMDLKGSDLPKDQHLAYDQIDGCLRVTVFPGLDVLEEDLQVLHCGSTEPLHPDEPDDLTRFTKASAYLCNEIEITIIADASHMAKEMKPTVK